MEIIRIDLTVGDIKVDTASKEELEKLFLELADAMENKKFKTIRLQKNTIINKDHIIRIIKEESD